MSSYWWNALLVLFATHAVAAAAAVTASRNDPQPTRNQGPMERVDLPAELVQKHGAYCLDGSPYKYFIRRTTVVDHKHDYVLYFQGGGWCYTRESCIQRQQTYLGSSLHYPDVIHHDPTLMSTNPWTNPLFSTFNHVFLPYCDGASFTGSTKLPDPSKTGDDENDDNDNDNQDLVWFRGKHNLESVLEHTGLMQQANRVLITGCSSGGLSSYIHANPIRLHLPVGAYVKALPESGLFLFYPNNANGGGPSIYETGMRQVFELQNCTSGVNQQCIQSLPQNQHYKCMSAETSLRYTTTPLFLFQSVHDTWNMECILTAQNNQCDTIPEWVACLQHPYDDNCSMEQIQALWDMADYLLDQVLASVGPGGDRRHGAFLHSCFSHCSLEEHGDAVMKNLTVQGTSFGEALEKWWKDDHHQATFVVEDRRDGDLSPPHLRTDKKRTMAAAATNRNPHVYLPCRISANAPHECNPTCEVTRNDLAARSKP
ncbi:hypothetical protein ACA910_007712 [Epithemia clementina (nom. ined.)]